MKKPPQLEEEIIKAYERDYDITLEAIPETIRVRGNALASGDDALDKEAEDEIISRLESGDVWAWFTAKVSVRDSHGREASDYLGACCYEDGEDFKRGGYYLDMIRTCVDEIEATPKTITIEEDQLIKLLALASSMADDLRDFGSENANYYNQQLNNWTQHK
jgi:hypothetical protein